MPCVHFLEKDRRQKERRLQKRNHFRKNRKRREETTLHLHKGSRETHVQQSRIAEANIRVNENNSHPEPPRNELRSAQAGRTDVGVAMESTPASEMTDWFKAEKETANLYDNQ